MNIGEFDQAQMAFKDLSKILADYYKELIAQGFDPYDAMKLVVSFQIHMLSNKG